VATCIETTKNVHRKYFFLFGRTHSAEAVCTTSLLRAHGHPFQGCTCSEESGAKNCAAQAPAIALKNLCGTNTGHPMCLQSPVGAKTCALCGAAQAAAFRQ